MATYLTGATVARTGDEMSVPALLLTGLAATGSVQQSSALLTGLTISAAAGGPVLGALLDRGPRPGRVLATALTAYAVGLGIVLAIVGHVPAPLAALAAVVTGLLNPAVSGGWTAQLPGVAGGPALPRANSLDAMTFDAAALAGPALAGVLASVLGAPAALAVAIACVAAAVPVAWSLPGRPPTRGRPLVRELTAGLRAIATNRPLLRSTATSVVSYGGVGMFVVCCPLLGEQRFGDAGRGALLLAVVAATGLAANAVLARRPSVLRPDTLLLTSTLLLGAALAIGTLPGATAAIAAAAVAGLGEGPQLVALFAIRHREAPDGMRARVFTIGASLKITGLAVGTAVAGVLAARSLTACLFTAAGVEVLAALTYLALRSGRLRTPSPAPAA